MNDFSVSFNQIPKIITNRQILNNGSQVLVKVISDKGDGKYEGSVAGTRVNIFSEKKLVTGSTFIANISTKNGTVYIVPQKKSQLINDSFQFTKINNNQIQNILKQLNLPPDNLSYHIFQQFKQMELREVPEILKKVRNLSLKMKGKEIKASEIISILTEKGIESTEDEIIKMLEELDGNYEDDNQSKKDKFLLMNKINEKKGKWYFIPFEITENEIGKIIGKGNIKIMFDFLEKLKIMNLDCCYENKKYLFNLEFKNEKCSLIRCYLNGEKTSDKILKLKKYLITTGCNPEINYTEESLIQGTACETEQIITVGGNI